MFNGDFNADGGVDFRDYSVIAAHWLEDGCGEPGWCDGTDFDVSGTVTGDDLGSFMQGWLDGIGP